LRKSGIRKSRKLGIMNRRSSGITDLRNYAFRSPKFGSHVWEFGNQKEAKSKTLPQKVRVWRVNLWRACKYMKSTPQITGCKRHLCICSH
jgi:hypothetical protein